MQNLYLILVLAASLGTLVGAWFAAKPDNGAAVWLFLVATASCGLSAFVVLMLLAMIAGFHQLTLLDAVLAMVVVIGAVRTWGGTLDQIDWTTHSHREGDW
ncbi:membrane protein of unknown function [Acidithiobacillus ferrivorans]|nr:hypothetical protein [Acidithiobacillus ferrivorans]SMH64735.1 membrane protein of unknown function [Acidithiobacillus ferrivorans]